MTKGHPTHSSFTKNKDWVNTSILKCVLYCNPFTIPTSCFTETCNITGTFSMTIPAKELYEVVWHIFQVRELCLWPIINYDSLTFCDAQGQVLTWSLWSLLSAGIWRHVVLQESITLSEKHAEPIYTLEASVMKVPPDNSHYLPDYLLHPRSQ